jgi:hypothetical protein
MRRTSVVTSSQIDFAARILQRINHARLSNFEHRMIAEVQLYWLIYQRTSLSHDHHQTEDALRKWKQDWAQLFGMT